MIYVNKIFLIFIIFISYPSHARNISNDNSIASLNCFKSEQIDTIKIRHIPSYILTRTNVTPKTLEQMYNYSITIKNISDTPYGLEIVNSINKTNIKKNKSLGDLRWGVFLYNDKELSCSIYFNGIGSYGEINGEIYYFTDNKILKWIKRNISFITMNE